MRHGFGAFGARGLFFFLFCNRALAARRPFFFPVFPCHQTALNWFSIVRTVAHDSRGSVCVEEEDACSSP